LMEVQNTVFTEGEKSPGRTGCGTHYGNGAGEASNLGLRQKSQVALSNRAKTHDYRRKKGIKLRLHYPSERGGIGWDRGRWVLGECTFRLDPGRRLKTRQKDISRFWWGQRAEFRNTQGFTDCILQFQSPSRHTDRERTGYK